MKNAKKLYLTNFPTIHYGGEKGHTSTCNCSDNCNTKAVTWSVETCESPSLDKRLSTDWHAFPTYPASQAMMMHTHTEAKCANELQYGDLHTKDSISNSQVS